MDARLSVVAAFAVLLTVRPADADELMVDHLEALEYPPAAAQAGIAGEVSIRCVVDRDGQVARVQVLSGDSTLSHAARENATKWRFRHTTKENSNANSFDLIYRFRLKGTCFAPRCTSIFSFDYPNSATVLTQVRHWTPSTKRD